MTNQEKKKVLLLLLPFWDPQIPPLGIASIKTYLNENKYTVKCIDYSTNQDVRVYRNNYFNLLDRNISNSNKGNLYNIGNQLLRNHLVIYQNRDSDSKYFELLNEIIANVFYLPVSIQVLEELDQVICDFYKYFHSSFEAVFFQENPDVLGITVYGDTLGASLYAFKQSKNYKSDIINVMGGGVFADQLAPGSSELDYFIEKTNSFIDYFVIGEGEEIFLQLLEGNLDQKQKIFLSSDSLPMQIGKLKIPDFDDFQIDFYPHLAHYGARSCPYQCKFCSETINWGKYRKKDISKLVDEFNFLYEKYKTQLFLLTDSTLNPIVTPLSELLYDNKYTIYWDGFLRADKHVCNKENTLKWRRGGFYRAKLGLESGSQRVLDLMNKKTTITQYEEALSSLAYAGIKTTTFWLFGFPGETDEDFQQTLDFLERNRNLIYEADCNAFNYYLTGQANSDDWSVNSKAKLLYPEWAKEMLISQTWYLDEYPSRKTAYERLNIFCEHCKKIGIPNPYSLKEVDAADKRWKKLHKNAVPLLVELQNKEVHIDECRYIRKMHFANTAITENEFDFEL